MPATRRAFVVAVATGLAGCTAIPGRDTEDPPDDHPTDSDGPPPTADDCTSGFHVSLEAFAPSEDLPMHVTDPERELVASAVEGGSTTHRTYGEEPLRSGVVAHDGAYYWLAVSESGGESVPAYLFDISWEKGQPAPEDATLFAYDDLPESDREAIQFLVPNGEGEEDHGHPTEGLSGRDRPVPYRDGGDDSELLGHETVWVRYDGREYRLSPGEPTTTELNRYRYTAEQVASTDADLGAWAAERYVVDLELSDEQRDLLDAASADSYEECAPASDTLASIHNQLPDDGRLPRPADGWYVAYDGERHRLEILEWVE